MSSDDLALLQAAIDEDFPRGSASDYPGGWPGEIEAALIDAVFSIRARYGAETTGVRGVVRRWRETRDDQPLDDLAAFAEPTGARLHDVAANGSRTGGQPKSVAVESAARRLVEAGVSTSADLETSDKREAGKLAYTSVDGLGWVTWSYFLMLLGHPDVKADVHLCAYVSRAVGGRSVDAKEAHGLLQNVTSTLGDLIHLDHAIWDLQRKRGRAP